MPRSTEHSTPGRPRKGRMPRAGDKLRMAFMLLQKTWGSNTSAENHVFNMKRWSLCGLPRSIKTVKEDIRGGVAYDRLSNYASLLNVPASMLSDDSIMHSDPEFVSAIVKMKTDQVPPSILFQHIFGNTVSEKFLDYNRQEYTTELFETLKGFYVVYLSKIPFDVGINKMAFAIHEIDAYCLKVSAKFYLETDMNTMHGEMHRWGSFLQAGLYMNEMQSFATALFPEPLRTPLVAARKPFSMLGKYLFGADPFGREPLFALLYMERRQNLPEMGWEEAFETFCRDNLSYQFLFSGDPEYDYALVRLRGDAEGEWDAAP